MGSVGATEQRTAKNLISNAQIEALKEMRGENRADLINQVAEVLNGRIGGLSSYRTKNDIVVDGYSIVLTTRKDKKTNKQKITGIQIFGKNIKETGDFENYFF